MRVNKKKISKAKKPKAALGTMLTENADTFGQGFSLAGQLTDAVLPQGSVGGGIASGALKGAGALAAAGPIGMGVGAVIGGVTGLVQAKKAQRAEQTAKRSQQRAIQQQLMANAGNAFDHGGVLDSKLKVVEGGNLQKISKNAVEVKANNPGETDSVELEQAFVDHNEVIDDKDRVFSDTIKLPNGKSVAKEAKRLEKMKNKNPRFNGSNELIESKINALFDYQESTKPAAPAQAKLQGGGDLPEPDPKPQVGNITNKPYKEPLTYTYDQYKKGQIGEEHQSAIEYFKRNPGTHKVTIGTTIDQYGEWPGQAVHAEQRKGPVSKGTDLKGREAGYDTTGQLPSTEKSYLEEVMKKAELKKGGKIHIKPSKVGSLHKHLGVAKDKKIPASKLAIKEGDSPAIRKKKQFAINARKWKHSVGGIFDTDPEQRDSNVLNMGVIGPEGSTPVQLDNVNMKKLPEVLPGEYAGQALGMMGAGLSSDKKKFNLPKIDAGKALTGAATFAPNVLNTFLQKKLQGPAAPRLEQATRLQRLRPDAQLTEAAGDYRTAAEAITRGTGQGSALGSNIGSLMAKKLGANNQIFGQLNAQNTQIQGQEAMMNQQSGARNTERLNQFQQGLNDFANRKLQLSSENTANLSGKILQQGREKNEMERDKFALDVIKQQFGDSGIFNRELGDLVKNKLAKKKMGGKLAKKRRK